MIKCLVHFQWSFPYAGQKFKANATFLIGLCCMPPHLPVRDSIYMKTNLKRRNGCNIRILTSEQDV